MAEGNPVRPRRSLLLLAFGVGLIGLVIAVTQPPHSPEAIGRYAQATLANGLVLMRVLWPWVFALNLGCGLATELLSTGQRGRVQVSLAVCSLAALVPAIAVVREVGADLFVGPPPGSPAADVAFYLVLMTVIVVMGLVADASASPMAVLGCLAPVTALALLAYRLFHQQATQLPLDIRVIAVAVTYTLVVMAPQMLVARLGDRWRWKTSGLARLLSALGVGMFVFGAVCLIAGSFMVYSGL